MPERPIGAVTFDLWDCLFMDDTDEPKRAAAGLPPKPRARRDLVYEYLNRQAPITRETVDLAYGIVDAAFRKVWHDQHVTWSVRERHQVLLDGLGRELPEAEFAELVARHETMELDFRPDPAPGAVETLHVLKERFPLVVVSDTVNSPGTALRDLLKGAGLFECFRACVFSDEVGRSKPAPEMFQAAAAAVGARVEDLVHIGDRPHNDVGGAHGVGARAVLLTVVKQRPLDGHTPDAVCDDYAKLPAILEDLNG